MTPDGKWNGLVVVHSIDMIEVKWMKINYAHGNYVKVDANILGLLEEGWYELN